MSAPDPAQVLKTILADPEFQTDWRELLSRWIEKEWKQLAEWLGQLPGLDRAVILVLCLMVLAVIGWSVVQGFREGAVLQLGTRSTPPEEAPAPSPAARLADRARSLAAQGKLREAARTLQQAVYRALADRAGLGWDGAKADWEWVARLGGKSGLRDFTEQAQLAAYGVAAPDLSGFEGLWSDAKRWVAA